jgi:cytochrome oxidase Cu insertion factor (SCO1/SenC/PrrC family)
VADAIVERRRFGGRRAPAVAALVIATLASACGSSNPGSNAALAHAQQGTPAAPFTLVDQFGHRERLSDFRGSVVLLSFIDPHCTTVCPLTADLMRHARDEVGAATPVKLVAIDANPNATSVADVRRWSIRHRMLHDWLFLTAPQPRLARVWAAYGVRVIPRQGDVAHSAVIFVIDAAGRQRAVFPIATRSGMSAEVGALAEAVRRVA